MANPTQQSAVPSLKNPVPPAIAATLRAANDNLRNDQVPLTADQVDLYRNHCVTLVDPAGGIVDIVGATAGGSGNSDDLEEARNLLSLLEMLVVNKNGGLELSESASAGLADVLMYAQRLIE